MAYFTALIEKINLAVARSTLGRLFRLEGCDGEKSIPNTRFSTEIRAGLTTFFTMTYIISINALIMKDSGATCVCTDEEDPTCFADPDYNECLGDVHREFITATAAISGFASCLFGILTNLPISLAPGMGVNAYFVYQVVGYHGTGPVSYRVALLAVFIEGWIFVLLSLLGMRQWLVRLLPTSLKIASACGIGLFLALVGLSYTAGIGAITGSYPAPLDLGGCPTDYLDEFGMCTGKEMQNPAMWIGICMGGIVTVLLMAYKFKSSMIVGILLVSIMSWPRGTSWTYFPDTDDGDTKFEFFKKVVSFQPLDKILTAMDWTVSGDAGHFALAMFTLLYVDILDCTATLYSMARFAGVADPVTADFPRSTIAYCVDGFSISIGALFGLSPVTAFIESGAGITEGGKTGLSAVVTGICFIISIFFAPIFASIPPWATGSTLILIGCMMIRQVVSINWVYIGDAVPAFVTLMFIPFSYSIAYGILAGIFTHIAINGLFYLIRKASGDRFLPENFEQRERWLGYMKDSSLFQPIYFITDFLKVRDNVSEIVRPQSPASHNDAMVKEEYVTAEKNHSSERARD